MNRFTPPKRDLIYPPGAGGNFIFTNFCKLFETDISRFDKDSNTNEYHTARSTFRTCNYDEFRLAHKRVNKLLRMSPDYSKIVDFVYIILPKYNPYLTNDLRYLVTDDPDTYETRYRSFIDVQNLLICTNVEQLTKDYPVEFNFFSKWLVNNFMAGMPHGNNIEYQSFVQHIPFHISTNLNAFTLRNYSYVNIYTENPATHVYFSMLQNGKHGNKDIINQWKDVLGDKIRFDIAISNIKNNNAEIKYSHPKFSLDLDYYDLFLSGNSDGIKTLYDYFSFTDKIDLQEVYDEYNIYHMKNLDFIRKCYGKDSEIILDMINNK